jgi:hypothetical protein
MPTTPQDDSLGVLRGAKAIGAFAEVFKGGKVDERKTYYLLENRIIPAFKEGSIWTTTKARLRAHYNNTPTNIPPATSTEPTEPNSTEAEAPPPPTPRSAPTPRSGRPPLARRPIASVRR